MGLLTTLLLALPTAFAVTPLKTTPPREALRAGSQVTLSHYIEASDAFEVEVPSSPGIGPNYAAPEDLRSALGLNISVAEFRKKSLRDLGTEFVLHRDLVLLWPVELKIRARHKHKDK